MKYIHMYVTGSPLAVPDLNKYVLYDRTENCLSEHLWAFLGLSGPLWAYLGLSGLSGPLWASLSLCGPLHMDLSGHLCASLGLSEPI